MTPHQWIADPGRLLVFTGDGALLVTGQYPEKLTRYVGPAWTVDAQVSLRESMYALAASPITSEVCLGKKTAVFHDARSLKKRPGSLKGHKYELGAVAYAPDGAHVFTGGGGHITPPDHSVRIFDLAGVELAKIKGPTGEVRRLGPLDAAAVLVLDTQDGLAAYDVVAGRALWRVATPPHHLVHGPFALDAAANRVHVALQTDDAASWWVLALLDARTGEELRRAHLFAVGDYGHVDDVALVGPYVAVSMGQNAGDAAARKAKVHLFDRTTLARGPVLEAEEQTGALAASRDGRWLAATMRDLGVAVFDMHAAV